MYKGVINDFIKELLVMEDTLHKYKSKSSCCKLCDGIGLKMGLQDKYGNGYGSISLFEVRSTDKVRNDFDYIKYGRSTEGKRSHILMLVLDGVRTFSKSKCRYGISTRTCTPEYALYSYLLMGVGEANFLKQDEILFCTRYEICI